MSENKEAARKVDYSDVTPATGTRPDNKDLPEALANQEPTADMPSPNDVSKRSVPDKTIPGPEAASSVDAAESAKTVKETGR